MVYVRRIDPKDGLIREILDQRERLRSIETRPTGNVTSREDFVSINPDGIETIIGQDGLQEYVNDITPPNKPAAPSKLEPTIGGILLTWNGLDWAGQAQPKDYSHTDVEVSADDGATWTVASVVTATSPSTTITGLLSGKTYSVRLRSFDQNKNASEYSFIVSGGKTLDLPDYTEVIEDLRNEHTSAIDELESALSENTNSQRTLAETIRNLREEKIPNVELAIAEAQKSIVSNKEALALIPGDIATAKQAAIDAANATAIAAIELAQMSGQSLITNGNMDAGQSSWTASPLVTFTAAAARGGALGMRVAPTTANASPLNVEVQTSSDRTYYLEMWVKRTGADTTSTGSIGFLAQTKNTAGTTTNTTIQGTITEGVTLKTGDISTTVFTRVKAEWTVPAGDINRVRFAPWFKLSTTNVYFVDDMIVVDITESKNAMAKAIEAASTDAAKKIAAAEAAMAIVAQGFANKAKDDAISSSLNTAIEKANAAKADAVEASRLEAELLANQARIDATRVADAAQQAATKAQEDVLKAAQVAASKSKVLIQATAPGVEDRNTNTLWIDTSGSPSTNTPKRWVSGTTWTAVTDKTASDAATLATEAQRAAATAAENALAAGNLAGSKGKVLVQATAPGAEDRNTNTLWIDTSGSPAANTPKRWTTGTTWVAVTDKAATDAATAAATAIRNAESASELAASKGKVLAQPTAPGVEDRNLNTLWIDTSGTPPQNTPKRWTTGTTWVAVTDKAATDAATAAAKAIKDAEDAKAAAQTATDAAGNAMQAAGSKTKVHYSASNPSGIGAIGDTWRKTDTNGDIIGEWRYTGGNPAWTAQLVTTTMLSNVDIGKLTVGTAVMQQGVADEFFAKIFSTNKLFAENVIIGEAGNSFPDPFFKDTEGWKPFSILPTGGRNNNPALIIPAVATQSGMYYGNTDRNRQFPVIGKSSYRVSVWVKADAATVANGIAIYAKWSNPTTAVGGVFATPQSVGAPALPANTWKLVTAIFEFPEEATKGLIGFYVQGGTNTRVLFSEPSVVRMIEDALVVEGGIKARSIEASGELSAKVAKFLEVSTDMLVAGSASITSGVADRFYAAIFSSRKIYTNQLVIGQPGNLMPDPGFLDAEMTKMRNEASTCTVTTSSTFDLALIATGTSYFRPLGIKQDTVNFKNWIPVQPGEVWEWGATVVQMKTAGNMKFVGRTLDGSAYKNPSAVTTIPVSSSTIPYKVIATIPADCYWICPEMAVGAGTQWIDQGTIYMRQVITPALVVDGLVSGQNIIGAVIQTLPEANRGIKMSESGLVAYNNTGVETLRFDGQNSIITGATYRTAATGARVQLSTTGLEAWNTSNVKYLSATASGLDLIGTVVATGDTTDTIAAGSGVYTSRAIVGRRNGAPGVDLSPGFWLEVEKDGVKFPAGNYPAGLRSTSPYTAEGAVLQAARVNNSSTETFVSVDPRGVSLRSMIPYSNGYAAATHQYLSHEGDYMLYGQDGYPQSGESYAIYGTSRRNAVGVGDLRLYARSRLDLDSPLVSINGTPMTDTGWKTVSYASPWTSYGNGFSPLSYRVSYGTLYLMGSVKGGTSGSRVTTLPVGARPKIPTGTEAIEAPLTATQGGQWYAGSLWVYGDGRVVYTAAPGVWTGADRAIINASFPLG